MKWILNLVLVFILFSCNDQPANTSDKDFQDELRNRELRKISDGEIIDAAMKRGNIIADSAQKLLGSTLKSAIKEGGVQHAISFCNLKAYGLMDSLSNEYSATIRRASLRLRNPDDKADKLEEQLLNAYQYQIETGDILSPNIQRDGEYLLYTRAITINDGVCLNCHGEPGKHLKTEDYELIKSLYPEDNASSHKMGDLRGMWSIRLSKKDIIKSL